MTKLVALALLAACSPETTTFRTPDRGDDPDRPGVAAAYEVRADGTSATVHVWSNGGYIGNDESPMVHVGFEVRNNGARRIAFDSETLRLVVRDREGARLPATFVAVTPLGPALVPIAPGATSQLDAYFRTPVRPRAVDRMEIDWSLRDGDLVQSRTTHFVRDEP